MKYIYILIDGKQYGYSKKYTAFSNGKDIIKYAKSLGCSLHELPESLDEWKTGEMYYCQVDTKEIQLIKLEVQ